MNEIRFNQLFYYRQDSVPNYKEDDKTPKISQDDLIFMQEDVYWGSSLNPETRDEATKLCNLPQLTSVLKTLKSKHQLQDKCLNIYLGMNVCKPPTILCMSQP